MQGTRLKVIHDLYNDDFEEKVNAFLSELDANNLPYELSFKHGDEHCAYISYSNPKLRVPIKEKKEYCSRCSYFSREHKGCNAYCCEEFYQGF